MFHHEVIWNWMRALQRRGNRDKTYWNETMKIAKDYLPKPRILHLWPEERFAVKHPR